MRPVLIIVALTLTGCASPPPKYKLVAPPAHLTETEQRDRMEECRFKATMLRRVDYFYSCLQGYGFQLERDQ